SYSKTFEGDPQVNINLAATHSQNTNTQQINMTLPNLTASVSRIYPFAPKNGSPKKGIIQNINLQYDLQAQNSFTTTDSLFFKPEMFKEARFGARHSIPISTNFKIFNYLSASLNSNFQETWVLKTFKRRDADLNDGLATFVQDTVNGFDSYRTYNLSASIGTTIYGMFNFGDDKKIQAIRHVIRPTLSYGINPGFEQFYDDYIANVAGTPDETEIIEYSRFQNTLFGAPQRDFSSSMSFNVSNTIEAKVRSKDSTATEPKKIKLLNNLNFSTSYNFAADSLKLSPINFRGSIPILEKLDINFGGTLDPYALDNNNRKINKLNINNGGGLFRLTNFRTSFNYSFSSKDFKGDGSENRDRSTNETFRNGGRPDDLFGESNNFRQNTNKDKKKDDGPYRYYSYTIPWTLRLAYTINYRNSRREKEISSHSLMFSGNVELSPNWSVGVSSGYDFVGKGFTFTQFRFQRDLKSWAMNFNWVPFSSRSSWYFFIGISSSVLSDIKYDKNREPDRQL
ncbi:MAG: LPS-assembly protein LptD, partial [Flavobacteriaceae bacterium]|nr:LPS-assembly protein LptD [Flavobacteriaceae bacterium]